MTLQSAPDNMISHEMSSVYGSYVITFDGAPRFVTTHAEVLFENLQGIEFKDCGSVRILLVSSEDWSQDDITAFVWEAMRDHYGQGFPHDTLDEWDEYVGYDMGFVRWGYDEFDPAAEGAKRNAEFDARDERLAALRRPKSAFAVAAE